MNALILPIFVSLISQITVTYPIFVYVSYTLYTILCLRNKYFLDFPPSFPTRILMIPFPEVSALTGNNSEPKNFRCEHIVNYFQRYLYNMLINLSAQVDRFVNKQILKVWPLGVPNTEMSWGSSRWRTPSEDSLRLTSGSCSSPQPQVSKLSNVILKLASTKIPSELVLRYSTRNVYHNFVDPLNKCLLLL